MPQTDKASAGESGHESLSPEDLNARLIQVLETSKVAKPVDEEGAGAVRDKMTDSPSSSEHRRREKRFDSPNDAFKEVFSEYGAKLSPSLMRMQLEGDLCFDNEDDFDKESGSGSGQEKVLKETKNNHN